MNTTCELMEAPALEPETNETSQREYFSYVLGFYFDAAFKQVVLMKKNRPAWQAGLHNGVG